jgi:hypothetical protein
MHLRDRARLAAEGRVLFGYRKWREEVEFMAPCSTKWATSS